MKVTVESLPKRQVVLNIEADAEQYEAARKEAYQHLAGRARIPGFRQGKAPLAMVERWAGRPAFLEEVLHHLVPSVTAKAIEEHGVEAIGPPEIELVDSEPASWKAVVDLAPEVDLGAYRDIRIPSRDVEVDPAELDRALEALRFEQGPWEPADRPAQVDDLVTLDVRIQEDGKQVGDDKGVQYRIAEGFERPMPGFPEALVGLAGGQSKKFTLSVPGDSDHELAGKTIDFDVKLIDVKTKVLPELDDDFAKGVGEGFDTLGDLRDHVAEQIRTRVEREAATELQEQALQAVIEGATVEYSPALVNREAERMVQDQEGRLQQSQMSMDDYLSSIGKTRDEVLEEMKPSAQDRLIRSLVVTELKDQEGVTIGDNDVDGELDTLISSAGTESEGLRSVFDTDAGRDSIRRSLLTKKTLDRLVEIVTSEGPLRGGKSEEESPADANPS